MSSISLDQIIILKIYPAIIHHLQFLPISKINNRIGTTFLIREIIDGNSLLIPDFSAGFEYRIFAGEEHFLKTGLTRNSRIPSLNDRYWNPGGNPRLKMNMHGNMKQVIN